MKIKSIDIVDEIEDIFDGNVDVIVTLEDRHNYVVVVARQKNLLTLMEREESDFLSPGDPMIIVKKLTKEVIEKAIEAYTENEAYYLKFNLDVKTLNVLKERSLARSNYLDYLLDKDESIDIENYDLIDFNINNYSNNNFG